MRNKTKVVAIIAAITLIFTASASGAEKEKIRTITIRTDFMFNGYVAPYALAMQRGYFLEEGLNVKLEIGQGSAITIQTVASGQDTFGIADTGTVAKAISNQGIPVKVLSVHLQQIPMGFIYKPANAIKTPKDLLSRVIISSAGAAELSLLPAITSPARIDASKLNIRLVGAESRIASFLNTDNAVLLGFATGDYLRAKAQDPTIMYKSYGDFGLAAYGTGLIATTNTINKEPALVKKVVRAVQRGWLESLKDPAAAVAAAKEVYPAADAKLLMDGLQVIIEQNLLVTRRTDGKPLGMTAHGDWVSMLKMFNKYAGMKAPKAISTYYTNAFIPKF
jgi:NitT/TauT family transport system substrate-binding protein